MRKKLLLLIVLLMVFGVVTAASAQQSINVGDSVNGSLNNSTASYALTLKTGETVIVSLSSNDFDAYLTVNDASGNQVASDDDSGGGLNALLTFTPTADGTYTIVVGSFSGADTGAYTLTVSGMVTTPIQFGTPIPVTFTASDVAFFFTFEGKQGDVVDISGDSGGNFDTKLTLLGPDGTEIASDDDSGNGSDPFIHRQPLPADGTYTIRLEPFNAGDTGVLNLKLNLTEQLSMDNGPQTLNLTDVNDSDQVVFTAEQGAKYRITVTVSDPSASPTVQIGGTNYTGISVNASGVSEFSFVFTADSSGIIPVDVTSYSAATFTVSVETAQ